MNRSLSRSIVAGVAALALAASACGSDDGGGSADEFCDLNEQFSSGPDFTGSEPGDIVEEFERLADLVEDAADLAPSEIRDDVRTVADATQGLLESLEAADGDFSVIDDSFDDSETDAAGDRITAWVDENCDGITESE